MKLIMLMMLFATTSNPVPVQNAEYGPRIQPDMKTCLERRTATQDYFEKNIRRDVQFTVFCVEFRALGYAEAVANFKRRLGVEM